MKESIQRFLERAAPYAEDTGHNTADREMREAIKFARDAATDKDQKQAVSMLIRDVLPFIPDLARAKPAVNYAIQEVVQLDRVIHHLPPAPKTVPLQGHKLDMPQVISNFLQYACSNLPHTGHNAADRDIQSAVTLARSATTPQQQNQAIRALVRDVLPFVDKQTRHNVNACQAISDLEIIEQRIQKNRPSEYQASLVSV
ncbi:hypothetical protein D3C79_34780 [compost metagenome]